ncbi:MAG TPA: hypothetical protein VGF92_16475 [Stellaceae bacterium]
MKLGVNPQVLAGAGAGAGAGSGGAAKNAAVASGPSASAAKPAAASSGAGAAIAAAGASATGGFPQPMQADCAVVHGKVPGPKNHLLCAKHGHVVDVDTKTIIARDVSDYQKRGLGGKAGAAGGAGAAVKVAAASAGAGPAKAGAAAGATGDLPQPMQADCAVVHGKVPGPKNHLLCAKHGHIVDIDTKTIIAHSVSDYQKQHPAAKTPAAAQGGSAAKVTTIDEEAEDIVVGAPAPKHDPQWNNRPQKIVHSAKEMDDDAEAYEDGRPPPQTAMALPPETAKEKAEDAKRKKQEAVQAKADHDRLDQRLHSPELVGEVVIQLRGNCDHYKIVIMDSCQAFSRYAEKKIEEFKQFQKSAAPLDLFKSVLEFALDEIGGKLGEKLGKGLSEIGGELAKAVGEKVYKSLEGDLVKAVADKLSDKDDGVPALEQAVKDISDAASRAGTAVSNAAYDTLDKPLTKIADGLKGSGNPLDPKDAEFLKDFATGDVDAVLERFGIPSRETAKSMQAEIYAGLVKKFEENRIRAWNAALGDYPGKETPSDSAVKGLAEGYAKDAKKAYQTQLDQDEAQRK